MNRRLLFSLGGAALVILGACTFISRTDVDQCTSNTDCARFGAGFACTGGVCVSGDGGCARFGAGFACTGGVCVSGDGGGALDGRAPDGGCLPKEPKTSDPDFLNEKCTNATCIPFDNCARLGICDDAGLPELIAPPDGGV